MKRWWIAVVAFLMSLPIYYLGTPQLQDLLYDLIGVASVVLISARLVPGKWRLNGSRPWRFLALGQLAFVVADLTWDYYTYVRGVESPFPSVADAFYLAAYPLLAMGLLGLARRGAPAGADGRLIDATIVGIGLGLVGWVYIAQALATTGDISWIERTVSLAYPSLDVVLLIVVVYLAFARSLSSGSDRLLAMSILATLVADVAYTTTLLTDSYHDGSLIDAGWLAGYALLAAAALHPSADIVTPRARSERDGLPRWRLGLLCGTAVLGLVVMGVEAARGRDVPVWAVVTGSVLLLGLVAVRLDGLNRSLTSAVTRLEKALRREHVLRTAGADILAASDRAAVRRAAIDGALALLGDLGTFSVDVELDAPDAPAANDAVAERPLTFVIRGDGLGNAIEVWGSPTPVEARPGLEALASYVGLALERAKLAEELSRLVAAEERTRVARELHDLIAHSLGAILLQARGALGYPDNPAAAFAALQVIEERSAEAVDEFDVLLGLLRQDVERTAFASNRLRYVERLISGARGGGVSAELRTCGDLSRLPPAVDLSAFRIVQEALTNAMKHSAGEEVLVELCLTDDEVVIEVTNTGKVASQASTVPVPGSGLGIVGMRERVLLLHGTLDIGPLPGGGWGVRARLPVRVNST